MSDRREDTLTKGAVESARDLMVKGKPREAAGLLEPLVAEGGGGLFARLLLVRARIATGGVAAAVALARELALSNAQVADTALVLGEALAAARQLPTAIAEFQRALRLDPALAAARIALANAWLDAGEPEKAEEALGDVDDGATIVALRARVQEMRVRPRSDSGYVRHLFDQFSSTYDARMRTELAYGAPEILRTLANLLLADRGGLAVLDLGCGTGLAGAAFQDIASRLDGIDLSPAMLSKARKRGIYDLLVLGDIETCPLSGCYDLVVAADTFVYLGDLGQTFGSLSSCVKPGGLLLFTVEKNEGDGYRRGPKRRWQHSPDYLRRIAHAHGFHVSSLVDCSPRREAGVPVEGIACALERWY